MFHLLFGEEAVLMAVHIINRVPNSIHNGFSKCCMILNQSLTLIGCSCFVLLPVSSRPKLSARSCMCVFLGYGVQQKRYRYYDPLSNRLCISRYVEFLETIPYYKIPEIVGRLVKSNFVYTNSFPDDDHDANIHPVFDDLRMSHSVLSDFSYDCDFDTSFPTPPPLILKPLSVKSYLKLVPT